MVIPAMAVRYTSLTVLADAELVVQGPCTLVVGTLALQAGAEMTFDTTDGDVTLYVENAIDLAPGSQVSTPALRPEDVSIQVGEIAAAPGVVPVNLEATSDFHGTIYSPDTAVQVGSEFEVYGSMVAKSLELAPGVRLHFDNAGFDGSPLPRLLSWRIVEIPAIAQDRRDPFTALGVAPEDLEVLAEAHDLAGVYLAISYLDHDGTVRSFSGLEEDFDWLDVAQVLVANSPLSPDNLALVDAASAGELSSADRDAVLAAQ
ncbi:MAG: hypothetical protein GY711_17465 [bacterium]|nr:hypothetical protein [bacterium]